MPKRFHDTEIWSEDWFIQMDQQYQMFWFFICDNCDHAGIWRPNVEKFNRLFRGQVDLKVGLSKFNKDQERIQVLSSGRWFLNGFIPFQYGRSLNLKNHMHKSIYQLLTLFEVNLTSIRPQIGVTDTPKDKDKDKDKSLNKINKSKKKMKLTVSEQDQSAFEEKFWAPYPSRNGKKLDKQKALDLYMSEIKPEDRDLLHQAVLNYAASERVKAGIGIKDPHRFIKNRDNSAYWREWIEPEVKKDAWENF